MLDYHLFVLVIVFFFVILKKMELGRNNIHVKELNKIVSRFLLDSMAERQEPQRSRI